MAEQGTLDPRTPVLVGAGQVTCPLVAGEDLTARAEPVALMARALEAAADDAGGPAGRRLLQRATSIRVLVPLSWRYVDPGSLVAEHLGISPAESVLTAIGGNGPQSVVNQSGAAIAAGKLDVVLVTGAECIATRIAARRDAERPVLPWSTQPDTTPLPVPMGTDRVPVTDFELARGLDRPLRVYPLFENALRHVAGRSVPEHTAAVAALWSRFSAVAAGNPFAWSQQALGADDIATVAPENRMISFPYPKRMNAYDRVDQGAALILCSLEAALAAGVARDRLVFPVAGTDANDHWFLTHRADLHSSPAIRVAGSRALELAGLGVDDLAHVDLYSCFPCAVQIAAAELGITLDDPGRSLTVTGGLAFAGGPGNNYVTHSIATMAQRLRDQPDATGLVTGLGWYSTKHSVGLWSASPPASGFRHDTPQAAVDALPQCAPAGDYEGEAVVETYTVVHDAAGDPELGILALRTADGRRTWANTADADTLAGLEAEEGCGRSARVLAGARADLR
ncbi:MAG TPA: acetyl-CoA acetyltransferase [Acidimicrobiales bacterium]|nr:acetyl-CoA acetyltransferase [Acidimicrobiales bacterium]